MTQAIAFDVSSIVLGTLGAMSALALSFLARRRVTAAEATVAAVATIMLVLGSVFALSKHPIQPAVIVGGVTVALTGAIFFLFLTVNIILPSVRKVM